jgi:hypothetical protein
MVLGMDRKECRHSCSLAAQSARLTVISAFILRFSRKIEP